MNYRALCFVDMPFGQKSDLRSGVVVDFDQIYNEAIKPTIEQCGLEARRGDAERTGGIAHNAWSRGCCFRSLLWPILRSPMRTSFMNSESAIRRSRSRPCRFWPMLGRYPAIAFPRLLLGQPY